MPQPSQVFIIRKSMSFTKATSIKVKMIPRSVELNVSAVLLEGWLNVSVCDRNGTYLRLL